MTTNEERLAGSQPHADRFAAGHLTAPPRRKLTIVARMDPASIR